MNAERFFGTNTNDLNNPVGLQDWSYAYDNIGNRTASARANAISEYAANFLNQYTERTVPGYADVLGTAETNVTVTVNTQAVTRQDYYWHKRLDVDNVLTSAYEQIVTTGVYSPGGTNEDIISSVTGHMFVAETPEGFTYDQDGNLLTDGRWNYTWDAENRLVAMQTQAGLPSETPVLHVEFDYDYMSRRVGKTVYEWDSGATNWIEKSSSAFLYDGWNLISEHTDAQTHTLTNFFVWGLDLSGSLQGAGGVGGLLAAIHGTNAYFATYDANGNISEYLDADGVIVAHREYSPFGETVVATGDKVADFAHWFSTKYTDDETTLVYYGYRYYSPELGRWINRDPIGERGGLNLYVFVENNPQTYIDYLGHSTMIIIDAVDVSEVWALIYRVGFFCKCDSSGSCAWERAGGSGNQGHLRTIIAPWLRMEQKIQYRVTKSGWLSFFGTITGVITGSNAAGLIIEAINTGTTKGSRDLIGDRSLEEVIPLPELKELRDCTCETAGTADTKDELHLKVYDLGETVGNVTIPTH